MTRKIKQGFRDTFFTLQNEELSGFYFNYLLVPFFLCCLKSSMRLLSSTFYCYKSLEQNCCLQVRAEQYWNKSTEMLRQQIPLGKERERERKEVHLTEATFLNISISFSYRNFLTSSREVSQICCKESRVEDAVRHCRALFCSPCQALLQDDATTVLSSSSSLALFSLLTCP